MKTSTTHRFAAFALALLTTTLLLSGIGRLAVSEGNAALQAAAAAASAPGA